VRGREREDGAAGARVRGWGRQELEREDGRSVVDGASSRAGGRKELEGGRLARRDRRETFGSSTGRPTGVCFLVSEANERPAVAREGGRREGSGMRDGRGWPGRAGGSSSSSTAGLPLDGEELSFDFTIQGPQI
jgi:hypothetical protein